MRSSARIGSANRCSAAKQQTASKLCVPERQLLGVAAHVGGVVVEPGAAVSATARRASSPTRRCPPPAPPARPCGEVAGEVAGAAGHVEHAVAGREAQQQAGDPVLVGHARPEHALDRAAERGPPPALVDARHEAGEHQVLGRAGRLRPGGAEQVEVAAGEPARLRARRRERSARARARASAVRPARRRRLGQSPRLARLAWLGPRRSDPWATSSSRAISRSPSTRAGGPAGRPAIRLRDAVAELQREVRGGGAHQLAHVLDRGLAPRRGRAARTRSRRRKLPPLRARWPGPGPAR